MPTHSERNVNHKSHASERGSVLKPSSGSKPKRIRRHKPFDEAISPNAQRVQNIQSIDIIFGRGRGNQDHPGNRRMRAIIRQYKEQYKGLNRSKKRDLVEAVYTLITENGARFLHKSESDDTFVIVDIPIALQKVRNTLRCKKGIGRELCDDDDELLKSAGVSSSNKEQQSLLAGSPQTKSAARLGVGIEIDDAAQRQSSETGIAGIEFPASRASFAASLSLSSSIGLQRELMARQTSSLSEVTRNDLLSRLMHAGTANRQSLLSTLPSIDSGLLGSAPLGVVPVQGTSASMTLLPQVENQVMPVSLLQALLRGINSQNRSK